MQNRKFIRSRNGTLAGVCTGIANYFNIDSIFVKVVFFASIWSPIPIVMIYLLLWILMEKEPKIQSNV